MLLKAELWQAIALGIDAENAKIEIFIQHNLSRGIAREVILRNLIVQQTPDPYRVHSGFVYSDKSKAEPDKQCDVLVYDPRVHQPYYQIDEFVVVPSESTRVLMEVKSEIGDKEFAQIINMSLYAQGFKLPHFGFAYGGWTFDTFCNKAMALDEGIKNLPVCLVVHHRNYLAIRTFREREPMRLLIDFTTHTAMATAFFMDCYAFIIREGHLIHPDTVWDWFVNRLTIVAPQSKRWLATTGELHDCTELSASPSS